MTVPWELSDAERDVRRALNASRPHAARWAPPQGARRYGLVVHPATIRTSWVRSIARVGPGPSKYSHRPRWALIAWRRGKPVGALVQFACGASTLHPSGEDEPTGVRCPKCLLATGEGRIIEVA